MIRPALQPMSPRWLLAALLVAAGGSVLMSHEVLSRISGRAGAYTLGTALLFLPAAVLPALWPRTVDSVPPSRWKVLPATATVLAGGVLLAYVASRLLPAVFAGPPDAWRGDMLVIMEHAIRRLLNGQSPYAVHRVPWDAPLTYGPLLWLPHVGPHLIGLDVRIPTLVAHLLIPALCMLAAGMRIAYGNLLRAASLFALGAGIALHPEVMRFHQIGHTQVYWPLLPVFCIFLAQARWTAAAVCLGLLVSARTPLLSMVPVFLIYLRVQRALTARIVFLLGLAVLLPYVPFLIADPRAVKEGMFDTYVRVMKDLVWRTSAPLETYGITGRLLERGLERYVEVTQFAALGLTYACAWRSLKAGGRVEPWLALSILVFAMTTLWSVIYLYFDVWLLLACALVMSDGAWLAVFTKRPATAVMLAAILPAAAVVVMASVRPGARYSLDIGSSYAAGYTGGGFGGDVVERNDGRTAVWVEGPTARIRLPRAAWTGATIRIGVRPYLPHPGTSQSVSALLNGRALGRARLHEGWQEIEFHSRRRDWQYGFNVLDLHFAYAAPAPPRSPGGASRDLSAAVDFLTVE